MTERNGKALTAAHSYFDAMASRDVDKIVAISADDIVCNSPRGELNGSVAFRGFHEGFSRMIRKLTLLAAFGDDADAVIVYDADTHPVAHAIVAEHLTVKNGKIASTCVIYDAAPFAVYAATVRPH